MLFSNQYNFFGSGMGVQVFIFNNGWPNDGGQLFAYWVDDTGSVTMNNSPQQPSGGSKFGTTADWVAGHWHHVAFTWTPTQIRLFLDGGIVATGTPPGEQVWQGALWLGGFNGSMGWDGKLDELAVWDHVRYTEAFTPPTAPFVIEGQGTLRGTVSLQGYGADITDVNVTVQLLQGGNLVTQQKSLLDGGGTFTMLNVNSGTYDVAIKACSWLRKVVPGVVVVRNQTTDITATLVNGDNDGDNQVTSSDLAIVLASMDRSGD